MKIALIVASEFKDYRLLEMKLDELKVSEVISGTSNGYEMLQEYIKTRPNVKITLAKGQTSHVSIAYNAINEVDTVVIFANGDGKRTERSISNAINENKKLKIYSYKSNAFNIEQQNEYVNISMCGNLQKVSKIESICLNKEEVEELINKLTKIQNEKKKISPKSLSLYNIASWFISDEYIEKKAREKLGEYFYIDAGIPILQRNWVWSANKIITFWDSLYRGIPIGSIILNKKNGTYEIRRGRMADVSKSENINTITHELLDGQQRTTAIATAFSDPWDGKFNGNPPAMLWVSWDEINKLKFYLTTKQHPWGFDDNGKRLNPNMRNDAIKELFKEEDKNYNQSKAYPFICINNKVRAYPLCKIIKHINNGNSELKLEDYINKIHNKISTEEYNSIKNEIEEILNNYELPCVISEISGDDIELAFTRLNTQGEVLDGEELRYSIIKAKWGDAEDFINEVEKESKLFPASRTIITYLRLVESLKQTDNNKLPPYRDNLDDFKKNINTDDLTENYKIGINLFQKLNSLIRYSNEKEDFKLSAPLINFLGNDTKNRDIIFIFLYWLSKIENDTLSVEQEKIALGALTLMSWFSSNPSKIIEKLWNKINEIKDDIEAKDFWANCFYDIAFENSESKEVLEIYPAVSPKKLKEIIFKSFNTPEANEFYLQPNLSYDYKLGNNPPEKIFEDNEQLSKVFWWQTINNIIRSSMNHPYLAYYFQRHYMDKEFQDFDPTLTTKQNDIQRPWDIDHIIPQNKISQSSKCLYKFWIHSVGNYCAMDYSRNRRKSDKDINEDYINIYEELQLRTNNKNNTEDFIKYLSKKDIDEKEIENIENYPFVVPIVNRLILMYSHWYNNLSIEKLVTKHASI
ncbi:DUF262 domain-containing protein [Aliarcobacter cryaerophilus]|uniref:DUF262 domain-containing protein n=1 Tax=Aliarcobacter cryaerophilus TaxID=28198 RepID=UPI003DA27CD9